MKCGRKAIMWIALALCLICAVLLALALHSRAEHAKPASKDPEGAIAAQEDEDRTVDVPVDFAAWQERNPDIYAWIEYPGTNVDYPIVQSAKDDAYYLRRDIDGKEAVAGSLYTEHTYNSKTFDDPVTVIYGHNMANRSMFGGLQSYAETLKFGDNALVYIYQPDRKVTYRIFAGIPYDTSHILYYHDFTDEKVFNDFFQALGKAADDPKYKSDTNQNAFYSAEGCVNVDKTNLPQAGDKVVVLSVCKNGDDHHRYLLMAKLVEDSAAPITMTRGEAEAAGIPADRIQDKAAADAAAAAANVSAVEDAAANKTDAASKTDTAKTEHKG